MHRAFSGIPAGAVRVSPSRRTSPFIPRQADDRPGVAFVPEQDVAAVAQQVAGHDQLPAQGGGLAQLHLAGGLDKDCCRPPDLKGGMGGQGLLFFVRDAGRPQAGL